MGAQQQLIDSLTGVVQQLQSPVWITNLQTASGNNQTLEAALETRLSRTITALQAYNPPQQSDIDSMVAELQAVASLAVPAPQRGIKVSDSFTSLVNLSPAALLKVQNNSTNLISAWNSCSQQLKSPAWRKAVIAAGAPTYNEDNFSYMAADNAYDTLINGVFSDFVTQMQNLQGPIQQGISNINGDIAKLADVSSILTQIGNVLDLIAQGLAIAAKF